MEYQTFLIFFKFLISNPSFVFFLNNKHFLTIKLDGYSTTFSAHFRHTSCTLTDVWAFIWWLLFHLKGWNLKKCWNRIFKHFNHAHILLILIKIEHSESPANCEHQRQPQTGLHSYCRMRVPRLVLGDNATVRLVTLFIWSQSHKLQHRMGREIY